tara:strand:- start:19427 stop:19549 length:123 start_codon:yes stop_codon:yes gene_type:complete
VIEKDGRGYVLGTAKWVDGWFLPDADFGGDYSISLSATLA